MYNTSTDIVIATTSDDQTGIVASTSSMMESLAIDPHQFMAYRAAVFLWSWGILFIAVLGVVGNIMAVMVLSMRAKNSSAHLYLLSLAVADFWVIIVNTLVVQLPRGFAAINTLLFHSAICKSWFYLAFLFESMSSYILAAVTIERALVVFYPLKATVWCTVKLTRRIIIAITVFSAVSNVHYIWSYTVLLLPTDLDGVFRRVCTVSPTPKFLHYYMIHLRPWVDLAIRPIIPFTCLLACNICIIGKLFHEKRKRRNMTEQTSDQSSMTSLTLMLLAVNFVYLVCYTPLHVMYVVYKYFPLKYPTTRSEAVIYLWWYIGGDAKLLNHSVNFLLYCLCGKQFRDDFKQLLKRTCGKQEAPVARGSTKISTKI